MKKIFKLLGIMLAVAILAISANLFLASLDKLEIPKLENSSSEYGKIEKEQETNNKYEIYSQKLVADEFISSEVNLYVDSLIEQFKSQVVKEDLKEKDKAVFKQVLDTYKVNENLVGIRVTSLVKKNYQEEYSTSIQTYNYNLLSRTQVKLEDIFSLNYKDSIENIYSEKYLLTKNNIEFYNNLDKNTCSYNTLKEYYSSKLLTKENFNITQEEFDELNEYVIDKNGKMVAITFDDGPHAVNTLNIVNMLRKYKARATFFMLGENVQRYSDVVKSVYESGNEIGIHTWSHRELTRLSTDEIRNEVESTSKAIYDITGEYPKLVRPPYGSINDNVKATISESLILWSVDSLDWKTRSEEKIVPLVMDSVQDGDIILLHDIHSTTVPSAEKIVANLKEQGYQLVTVSQMLEAKGYDISAIKVFYSAR